MPDAWTITKGTVEQYQIRGPGFAWAIITLDPRGIFQAVSDYGTYSYAGWGDHGCKSFKHFLVRLKEADYFIGKVCGHDSGRSGPGRAGQVFSFERTVKDIRRDLCERRRDDRLSKASARACWDEIEEKLGETSDEREFIESLADRCPATFERLFDRDYCEVSEACRHELAAGPLRFFEEIFRGQLVPALEAEFAAEAGKGQEDAAHP